MNNKIRILIADDDVITCVGVSAIVNAQADMVVIATATDGAEAVTLYREYLPDVVLIDMRMPVMSGVEASSGILTRFPNARIIALSAYCGDQDIRRALAVGVQSYLTKHAIPEELLEAIRSVYAGRSYIPLTLSALMAAKTRPDLTNRELHVLESIVRGLPNKQIAYSLDLAQDTVANHVKNIMKKLNVRCRTQAAIEAVERGIIHLSHK